MKNLLLLLLVASSLVFADYGNSTKYPDTTCTGVGITLCVKFNSGSTKTNEVADGAFRVEIDNKVYLDARNVFNRHYLNGPIDRVELFGWSQNGTVPFEVWFDNLKITTSSF